MLKIFIISIFIFLFSIIANGQGAVSYHFLEVVDYADKPVANAKVNVRGGCVGGEELTNQKGRLNKGFPIGFGDCHTDGFNILKTGYFPFADLFGVVDTIRGSSENAPTKVELLKIPRTKAERKAIGDEQFKREFFAAARNGDDVSVTKFLKSGFSPNLTTSALRGIPGFKNVPIILFAVDSGDGETVKQFLNAGVIINKPDEPLKNILIRYLSASPFQKNYPETEAGKTARIFTYEDGALSLIKAGASLEPRQKDLMNPLMLAAQKNYSRIVKKLIKKGIPVNAKDEFGRTALMYSADNDPQKGQIEIAETLIESGANINAITSQHYSRYEPYTCTTALMIAVNYINIEMIKLLLANGADANLNCPGGKSAMDYANGISIYKTDEKKEIIKLLEAAKAKD